MTNLLSRIFWSIVLKAFRRSIKIIRVSSPRSKPYQLNMRHKYQLNDLSKNQIGISYGNFFGVSSCIAFSINLEIE